MTGINGWVIQGACAPDCKDGDLGKCFNMKCTNSVKICVGNSALCSICHFIYSAKDFGNISSTVLLEKYEDTNPKSGFDDFWYGAE